MAGKTGQHSAYGRLARVHRTLGDHLARGVLGVGLDAQFDAGDIDLLLVDDLIEQPRG